MYAFVKMFPSPSLRLYIWTGSALINIPEASWAFLNFLSFAFLPRHRKSLFSTSVTSSQRSALGRQGLLCLLVGCIPFPAADRSEDLAKIG